MERISQLPSPSPVLGLGAISRPPLPAGGLDRGLTLALDGVQDPGNVGTLLRIADWFALDRVVLSPDCADLILAQGHSCEHGLVFPRDGAHREPSGRARRCKSARILGCDLEGVDVHRLAPMRDAVIVVGSEGRGLSDGVRALVTTRITIPRHGKAESLNAAIAAAIICDNLRRPPAVP